jgi:flagellar motor switch protein FliG
MPLTTTKVAHIDHQSGPSNFSTHHIDNSGEEHPANIHEPSARWLGAVLRERRVQRVVSGVRDLRQPDRRDEVLAALRDTDELLISGDQDEQEGSARAYFRQILPSLLPRKQRSAECKNIYERVKTSKMSLWPFQKLEVKKKRTERDISGEQPPP